MGIAVHLVVLQGVVSGILCTRHDTVRPKRNVFDKNSVGRLSVGFGKRIDEFQRNEMKSSNQGKTGVLNADNTALFNDILDRLSSGYGKRAMGIYKSFQSRGMSILPKRSALDVYPDRDFLRQKLTDILVGDIRHNNELKFTDDLSYDQEGMTTELYEDYQGPIREWIEAVMAEQ